MKPRLVPLTEVQKELGIGRWAARSLVYKGRLPAIKIGGRWFVDREDLDEFIQREKRRTKEPEFVQLRLPI